MSAIANIFQYSRVCVCVCVCAFTRFRFVGPPNKHLWCFPEQTSSVEVLAVMYCVTGRRPRFCALLLINNSPG